MADRRLQVFHAVAKNLSFTKAAELLFMSQPAVTFQIRQLEEQYNTRLIERGQGRIALTAAGELVLGYAERILALSDELETRLAEMSGEVRGPLMVGACAAVAETLLPPILGEFNAIYPRVQPCLVVHNSETLMERIAAQTLDAAFVEVPPTHPAIAGESCRNDELVLACAPDHPLAGVPSATPKALRDYEFISREKGSGIRAAVDAFFSAGGVPPESLKRIMELGSLEALKSVVASGLGFTIMPRPALEREVLAGVLVAVPLKPSVTRQVHVIRSNDRFVSRLAATFIDFAKQKMRETSS